MKSEVADTLFGYKGKILRINLSKHRTVQLKRAGFDAVIVEGKADKPVYVFIQDGEASIRDAGGSLEP